LQFFGSTVDRFGAEKQKKGDGMAGIGPGSYTVNNLINYHKKSNVQIYSGFSCTEERFQNHSLKDMTPGPGQY